MSTLTNAQRPGAAAIWLFDEGKGDMATDSSQHKHTAKVEGKVKWDQSKIGQAGQFQPDNYFVVDHTKTLNLSTFTITVWVKFSKVPVVGNRISYTNKRARIVRLETIRSKYGRVRLFHFYQQGR